MPNINICVRNKIASAQCGATIVCKNDDYKAIFDFDKEWDKYKVKTAKFSYDDKSIAVVFIGNECHIPKLPNTLFCGIDVQAGNITTAVPAWVDCLPVLDDSYGEIETPTPSVYDQLMQMLKDGVITGAKIVDTVFVGRDENGGNVYKQIFDNGTEFTFTAPKGFDAEITFGESEGEAYEGSKGAENAKNIQKILEHIIEIYSAIDENKKQQDERIEELKENDELISKELSEFIAKVNDLLDSDDTTLDEMHEIVEYIKANKGLIDNITINKVNVSDIIDDLTTSDSKKPLSAKQGVALKTLIDELEEADKTFAKANSGNIVEGNFITIDPNTNLLKDSGANKSSFVPLNYKKDARFYRIYAVKNNIGDNPSAKNAVTMLNVSDSKPEGGMIPRRDSDGAIVAPETQKTGKYYVSESHVAGEISRLTKEYNQKIAELEEADKANSDSIEILTNGISPDEIDGVKDLIDYTKEHGPEVVKMKEDISSNSKSIKRIVNGETEVAKATSATNDGNGHNIFDNYTRHSKVLKTGIINISTPTDIEGVYTVSDEAENVENLREVFAYVTQDSIFKIELLDSEDNSKTLTEYSVKAKPFQMEELAEPWWYVGNISVFEQEAMESKELNTGEPFFICPQLINFGSMPILSLMEMAIRISVSDDGFASDFESGCGGKIPSDWLDVEWSATSDSYSAFSYFDDSIAAAFIMPTLSPPEIGDECELVIYDESGTYPLYKSTLEFIDGNNTPLQMNVPMIVVEVNGETGFYGFHLAADGEHTFVLVSIAGEMPRTLVYIRIRKNPRKIPEKFLPQSIFEVLNSVWQAKPPTEEYTTLLEQTDLSQLSTDEYGDITFEKDLPMEIVEGDIIRFSCDGYVKNHEVEILNTNDNGDITTIKYLGFRIAFMDTEVRVMFVGTKIKIYVSGVWINEVVWIALDKVTYTVEKLPEEYLPMDTELDKESNRPLANSTLAKLLDFGEEQKTSGSLLALVDGIIKSIKFSSSNNPFSAIVRDSSNRAFINPPLNGEGGRYQIANRMYVDNKAGGSTSISISAGQSQVITLSCTNHEGSKTDVPRGLYNGTGVYVLYSGSSNTIEIINDKGETVNINGKFMIFSVTPHSQNASGIRVCALYYNSLMDLGWKHAYTALGKTITIKAPSDSETMVHYHQISPFRCNFPS